MQNLISISQDDNYNIGLSIHSVSIGQCKEICFSGGQFTKPVMLWLSWRELIRKPCPEAASIALRMSPRHGKCLVAMQSSQSYVCTPILSSLTIHLPSPFIHPLPCLYTFKKLSENRLPAINKDSYKKVNRIVIKTSQVPGCVSFT